jgi:hypothetical protein
MVGAVHPTALAIEVNRRYLYQGVIRGNPWFFCLPKKSQK